MPDFKATGIADEIITLLKMIRNLLEGCNCSDACHNCLKHYRNQYVHGMLDRFAALDLLNWGISGTIHTDYSIDQQKKMLYPLRNILEQSGCKIVYDESGLSVRSGTRSKQLVIYPAMRIEPKDNNKIFVSDGYIKYAKPYAVQKIIDKA